jgi:hypothetical protein
MSFSSDLDRLPAPSFTSSERLLHALEMYDEGVELQLKNLRRRHPHSSDAELALMLNRWLRRDGED